MPLDKNDLEKIEIVITKALEPMMIASQKEFTKIDERFTKIDERFTKIDERFERLEGKVDNLDATLKNQYPDKNYLNDKLADLAAEIGARIDRKKEQDQKFKEKVIEILKRNSLVKEEEVLFLKNLI